MTTHSSLLALINEQQQTRVPRHQTNRIKTRQVLAPLCRLRHVAKWSITLWRLQTRDGVSSVLQRCGVLWSDCLFCFNGGKITGLFNQSVQAFICSLICRGLLWPVHGRTHSSWCPQTFQIIAPALVWGGDNVCTSLIYLEDDDRYSSSMTKRMEKDISCLKRH